VRPQLRALADGAAIVRAGLSRQGDRQEGKTAAPGPRWPRSMRLLG